MQQRRISESEGGRDKPLAWGAPYQRKYLQPDFLSLKAGRRSTQAQRCPGASDNRDAIDDRRHAGNRSPSAQSAKTVSIKALFGAAKSLICRKDEAAPEPRRRRRGETGKGFAVACRTMLRRVARPRARARGSKAALGDLRASAALYLSDTLDWLNLWQDNADNDHWQEDDFGAIYEDYFPQP